MKLRQIKVRSFALACRALAGLVGAILALGLAAPAGAMTLSYSAYRLDDGRAAPLKEGEQIAVGEKISISIKYLNDSSAAARPGAIVFTLPVGCRLVTVDPAQSLAVSVDGGQTFGPIQGLHVVRNGVVRPARAEDVTHMRLALNGPLAAGDGGEVRLVAALR